MSVFEVRFRSKQPLVPASMEVVARKVLARILPVPGSTGPTKIVSARYVSESQISLVGRDRLSLIGWTWY
jgi:hypothetical protein